MRSQTANVGSRRNPGPGFPANNPGARRKQLKTDMTGKTIKHNTQAHWPQTREGIFDGVPPAPDTETEEQRHLK
jgi:hypothetical protein